MLFGKKIHFHCMMKKQRHVFTALTINVIAIRPGTKSGTVPYNLGHMACMVKAVKTYLCLAKGKSYMHECFV